MKDFAILLTLVVYHLLLFGIGAWAARRTRDGADFFLGGRRLGPWVAALSSAASSSSAWTLLGVSGAAFRYGLGAIWLLPACLGGFALNWYLVAPRLRRQSAHSDAVTLTDFLAEGDGNAARPFRFSASLIVLLCLGVYVSSQFQAAGTTFAETFSMDFEEAVITGGAVVLVYTLLGGFWAVSLTDSVQGMVMAISSVVVPAAALWVAGGPSGMLAGLERADALLLDPFRGLAGFAALGLVLGTLGIGLGYPGQPHVVNRFMALRDDKALAQGRRIAMGWALILYSGMLLAGWCGRSVLETMPEDSEAVLLSLTLQLFPPLVAGIILAAVLSAIMSTADSQLLVCASTVSHDLSRKQDRHALFRGRVAVFFIAGIAVFLALKVEETIFKKVLFAWSGLGAAFGPLLLVRLWRGPVAPPWALASTWIGFVVSVIWYMTPSLKGAIYELVPAFLLALIPAWLGAKRQASSSAA
ncbi:MAG: sodium/proline symporter [Planctomycetota bacterium]|nr:MAG: sodium/proline symporter [Planctomycetota bacterium]